MANNTAEIARLEALLRNGVTTVTVAGVTTTLDLNEIRRQLEYLRAADDSQAGRKPRIATINAGGLM